MGISGGIAAYKAPQLVRLLRASGADVRCALTVAAEQFVSPLVLEVLSGHAVHRQEYLSATGSGDELHIEVARWAELLCLAPATVHSMARLALGLGDDFLSTTALAFSGPLVVAPAMHEAMWLKESTQDHRRALERRGAHLVGPERGPLASGEIGWGRMADLEEIVGAVESALGASSLSGTSVVVSAGPTQEPIDPVRYLGNRSSGKMGFALAAEAARRGAEVTLVAGPVSLETPPRVRRVDVVTALEMEKAIHAASRGADLVIMTAAVADFRVANPTAQKIKKVGDDSVPELKLTRNPDILLGLATAAPNALRIGFAAETENLEEHALKKLEAKRVAFLVANDVSKPGLGFGADDNEVTVFGVDGRWHLGPCPKVVLASQLLDLFGQELAVLMAASKEVAETSETTR